MIRYLSGFIAGILFTSIFWLSQLTEISINHQQKITDLAKRWYKIGCIESNKKMIDFQKEVCNNLNSELIIIYERILNEDEL